MSRFRHILCIILLALTACESADPNAVQSHLEQLCAQQEVREEYLDFYWDDLRSHQPELWHEALGTCTETCPGAVNCGPILSVASWYKRPSVVGQP